MSEFEDCSFSAPEVGSERDKLLRRMLRDVIETVNIELGFCGLRSRQLPQGGAMVTPIFPFRVRPDFDTLPPSGPCLRDKTIVDVKRVLLVPLKVVS